MVLDASLFSTQHYKVRIKGKVEQSRKGVAPSPTHWCSSYRKGSLRVTLDYGRQLYFLLKRAAAIGWILASAVLSLQLWLVGSRVGCRLVGEALVRCVLLSVERNSSNFLARTPAIDMIYLISHRVRIWHKVWPRSNQDSCATDKKKYPDGIPRMGRFRHQAINLILQAGKELGNDPLRTKCHN